MQKYRTLLSYADRQRGRFALIFVLTLGTSVLTALQPWPLKLLADQVLGQQPLPALSQLFSAISRSPSSSQLLVWIVIAGFLILLGSSFLDMALAWTWTKAGRRMVYDLAEDLFARLQRRSLLFHGRNAVGDTMSRITRDCWCVHQVLEILFFTPLHALLTTGAMVYLMAGLDLTMTIASVALAPFMVAASFLVTKPLRAAAALRREVESRIQSHIQQTLTGIPVVQAFGQEEREELRFQKFADQAIEAQQRTLLVGSLNNFASGLVTVLGTGVILWMGANHVLAGRLTVGSILVFLAYLASLQAQIKVFANIHNTLQDFHSSVERVVETLRTPPEVAEKPNALPLQRAQGRVQFQNVSFCYDPGQPVLRNLDLDVSAGETIAIVGTSGAGKTTLVNLLPRFFDPSEGSVLLDGTDLRDFKLEDLRRQIALVLQEPYLFPLSVAENIAYGRPDASLKEIQTAAQNANAHAFIEKLPEGYQTILGERGITISGGERQRIAIARAFLRDAPIVILDEPTSALDSQTEEVILGALDQLMQSRTTFIIAHRLSTTRRADRILVMDSGRIAELGTHEELLARGGIFARMHHLQFSATA